MLNPYESDIVMHGEQTVWEQDDCLDIGALRIIQLQQLEFSQNVVQLTPQLHARRKHITGKNTHIKCCVGRRSVDHYTGITSKKTKAYVRRKSGKV